MLGNTLGWIISAVITAAMVLGGYWIYQSAQPTRATNWSTTHGRALTLDARPVLGPIDPTAGDAGKLYRDAISDYGRHTSAYAGMQGNMDAVDAANEAGGRLGLDLIVKARKCGSMNFFRGDPKEAVNFDNDLPALESLDQIVKTANNVALQMVVDSTPNYTKAEEYALASLAVGFNLYRERLVRTELDKSEDIMGASAAILRAIYQKKNAAEKLARVDAFDTARKTEVDDSIDPVRKVIFNISDEDMAQHTGDFFALASDPKADLVWRVEALRRIGHLRYNAVTLADQQKAPRFLDKIKAETNLDPAVKTAAEAALTMTPAEHQCSR